MTAEVSQIIWSRCQHFDRQKPKWRGKLGGCRKSCHEKNQQIEKMCVGVENSGGKDPKRRKDLIVRVISGQSGKIDHTFLRPFPDPPCENRIFSGHAVFVSLKPLLSSI